MTEQGSSNRVKQEGNGDLWSDFLNCFYYKAAAGVGIDLILSLIDINIITPNLLLDSKKQGRYVYLEDKLQGKGFSVFQLWWTSGCFEVMKEYTSSQIIQASKV